MVFYRTIKSLIHQASFFFNLFLFCFVESNFALECIVHLCDRNELNRHQHSGQTLNGLNMYAVSSLKRFV